MKLNLGKLDLSLNLKLADFNLKMGDIRLGQIPSWDLPALKLKLEGLGLDLTGVNLPDLTLGELNLRLKGINLSLADLNLKLGNFDLGSLDLTLGSFKIRDLGLTLPNLGLSLGDIGLDLPNMDLPSMTLGDFNLKLMQLGFGLPDVNITIGSIKLDSFNIFGDFRLIDLGLSLPTVPDLSASFPSFETDLELPDFKLPAIPEVDLSALLPKIFLRGAYVDIPDFKIGGFHVGSFHAKLIEKTKDKRDYVLDGDVKLNFSDIPGANGCTFDANIRMSFDPKFGRHVIEVTPLENKSLNLVVTPTNSTEAYTLPTVVSPAGFHQPVYVGQQQLGRDPRGIQLEKVAISMGPGCSGIHLGYGVMLNNIRGSFTLVDGTSVIKIHIRVQWPGTMNPSVLQMEADMDMTVPVQRCTLRDYVQFRDDLMLGNPRQVIEGMSENNCWRQNTTQSVDQLDPAKAKELPFMVKAVAYLTVKQKLAPNWAIWVVNKIYLKDSAFCQVSNWYVYAYDGSYRYDTHKFDQCQAFYRDKMPYFDQKYLSTPDYYTRQFADWVAKTQFEGGGFFCLESDFYLKAVCYRGTPYQNLYDRPWGGDWRSVIQMVGGPAYFYKDTLDWFDNLTPAEVSQVMRDLGVRAVGVKTEHYKEPFLLNMAGSAQLFGNHVGNANLTMKADQARGSLKYEKQFGPLKMKAGADLATWWGRGEFGFAAKGEMDLRVSLGFISSVLDDIGMDFHVKYELGKFRTPGGGQIWGFKGNFEFEIDLWLFSLSFDVDFFVGSDGTVAVGGSVGDYKLLSADAVRRAKQVQDSRQRGKTDVGDQVKFLDPDPDLTFLPAGDKANGRMGEKATDAQSRNLATSQPRQQDVLVKVNVANQQPALVYFERQNNGPTMELIGPDGQVIDPLHLP